MFQLIDGSELVIAVAAGVVLGYAARSYVSRLRRLRAQLMAPSRQFIGPITR